MCEQWTGDVIAKMHINGISKRDLAKKLGYSPEYTGKILNGKSKPKKAEFKFRTALSELILSRNNH